MASNSLINAALSARKTERALISAASASDLILEVFSMTLPAKLPAPLYVERPKLPPAIGKEFMVPRARPKHGRLPSPKRPHTSQVCGTYRDGAEEAESPRRPGTSGSSKQACAQGAVRDFLKQQASKTDKAQTIKRKETLVMEDLEEESTKLSGERGERGGLRRSNTIKNVAKAAGGLGRKSRISETDADLSAAFPDEVSTSAGAVEVVDGETSLKLTRRRGTVSTAHAEALSGRSGYGDVNKAEEDTRPSPRALNHEFDFKPKGSLDDRMKRLDHKRVERSRRERSKWRQENKVWRFNEMLDEEREALTRAFSRFDIDKSGYLDHNEVVACLREFGLHGTTAKEKRDILSVCVEASVSDDDDPNPVPDVRRPEDVQIDLLDLALTVVPCVRQALTENRADDLLKQFFKFDENGSGKLSQKEAKELALGMGLDPRMVEVDGAGSQDVEIDFETFQEMIVRGREQLERTCREKERHVQSVAFLTESAFQKFRRDLVPLYDVFSRYDRDQSGELSKTELMLMLQESGLAPRSLREKEDMKAIYTEHDHGDGSGLVSDEVNIGDFLEIVWAIRHYRQEKIKEEELERFMRYDNDRSGSLTVGEISRVLADLGLTPVNRVEQEEIAHLIASVDQDGSGFIDFREFQDLSQRIDEKLRSFRYEEEIEYAMVLGFTELQLRDLRQVFFTLDQDCSQKLDADEVRIGLAMMNKHVSLKVFEDTFKTLDIDGSGELDFMEFLQFMKMIVDQQGPIGAANSEEAQKLAQKPKELSTRILRRVLEYFRLAKQYIQSLGDEDLVALFCEYMNVRPEANLQIALEVKTVGELYLLAQERDVAMQNETS